jgi:RNA polymerase sigma factor (sigma-70 family)
MVHIEPTVVLDADFKHELALRLVGSINLDPLAFEIGGKVCSVSLPSFDWKPTKTLRQALPVTLPAATFARAWLNVSLVRSKDSVSDPLAVVRWLTVSLRRLAWRERANSAKRSNEEPTDDDLPRAPSAEHTAVLSDQQRRLWEMVAELSERCRRLLAVIAFAPRPDYAAIAVDLGIPVGSIGPTRGRCLAKLRARLDGGDWT